jgi:predicted esterase
MDERTIPTSTYGRYLVEYTEDRASAPILVGFHGYAESADTQLARLRLIPGAARSNLLSIQGLHAFYRGRGREVVASWMTREHRDLHLADNIAYVRSVIAAVRRDCQAAPALVCAGFSQGVAMAFRTAVAVDMPTYVIAAGADVPPELDTAALGRIRAALVGRGARDDWYSAAQWAKDVARLEAAGVNVRPVQFEGVHEWPDGFSQEAGRFLESLSLR